ncbi:MAG TPA: band-7 C-terminal domain-containing protein, partial [Burkholderiaceae bacterium]|nr:band-7 C-terminal domain-containing protein [Burkholderiaceae bacterium]
EIARSEGEKFAQINIAQGEAGAVLAVAEATARAIQMVAETIRQPGGLEAVNLRVADRFVDAFSNLAKTNNTLIVPSNVADISTLVASALTVVRAQPAPR